jgi:hypothetical protein
MTTTPVHARHLPLLVAGVAVAAVASRGLAAVVRLAVEELDYRAGETDAWWSRR